MDISILLIRVIFILIPGLVCNRLYRTLKGDPNQKDWEDFIDILFFSLLSYAIYWLAIEFITVFGYSFQRPTMFQATFDDSTPINLLEVGITTLIAMVVAVVAGYMYRFRVVNRVEFTIGAGHRFGGGGVWNIYQRNFAMSWVFVRDHKLDLIYFCKIVLYSDDETAVKELVLKEVDVYSNTTGDFLYSSKIVYLARDSQDITIEEPVVEEIHQEESVIRKTDQVQKEEPIFDKTITSPELTDNKSLERRTRNEEV